MVLEYYPDFKINYKIHHSICILVCRFRIYTLFWTRMTLYILFFFFKIHGHITHRKWPNFIKKEKDKINYITVRQTK
jgi:hypothetical protein